MSSTPINAAGEPDEHGSTVHMIEEARSCWYAPTVDDIGCVICAQCEDNFDQGCSRYVEVKLFSNTYGFFAIIIFIFVLVRSDQSRLLTELAC